ncbi:MAG: DUF4396 domain-containing protein [Bacteroidales bacterium]
MTPFYIVSVLFVVAGIVSALYLSVKVFRNPPSMKIMQAVWILTGLWAPVFSVIAYHKLAGRQPMRMDQPMSGMKMGGMNMSGMKMGSNRPFWQKVILSALHCGAGCTLADIIGEFSGFYLFGSLRWWGLYWQWGYDYLLALVIGVFFQFVVIRKMSVLSAGGAIRRALKVDFLSLTAWQAGMYLFLSLFIFVYPRMRLFPDQVEFWFLMQVAMAVGFLLAYPMNWILIKAKIKPAM